jgi:antitoxin component YwqK of YwqJK toxin-antitoxin module
MEDNINCYICYETESDKHKFIKDPLPCNCKGSILIHTQCFDKIIKTSRICSICKTKYKLEYLPNRNGLELIIKVEPNGNITEYTVNKEGEKHGLHIVKKKTSEIEKAEYINGLLHGKYRTWYVNGQLECECTCIRNRIEGEYRMWYENGQIMEHSFYVDGLKDGVSKEWDINGILKHNRIYIKGECTVKF